MASITSGEMANCDWLRRNFAGPLFPRNRPRSITEKTKTFQSNFSKRNGKI